MSTAVPSGSRGRPRDDQGVRFDPGSFRDPTNRIVRASGRILRLLDERATAAWAALRESQLFGTACQDGRLVPTRQLGAEETPEQVRADLAHGPWLTVLEHESIPFISYPFEWSFGMLRDAALLQLELLDAALEEGLTVKDASPYNIQWRGVRPQFIDIGSFAPWTQGEPWIGYRQFCQLFLFPLLLRAYKDVAFQPWLRGSVEGISPADFSALMSWRDRLRPGVLVHGWLQARLLRRFAASERDVGRELRQSGFDRRLIQNNVRRMTALLRGLEWRQSRSEWAAYTETCSYDPEGTDAKERFVSEILAVGQRRQVWDLGCNTGSYSEIAAEHADLVLAIDGDELSVEHLYRRLNDRGESRILPLVIDLRQATPGLGWRGKERA
ncbi:MAG: methyltransferase, partial [Acidobacteria bacterium]|nr:methyltransferase [Acidobacteriota bacterium]